MFCFLRGREGAKYEVRHCERTFKNYRLYTVMLSLGFGLVGLGLGLEGCGFDLESHDIGLGMGTHGDTRVFEVQ